MSKAKKRESLTDKQRVFIEHYLTSFNAADAARKAGYSANTAKEIGYENLTKPHIRTEIDSRLAAFHLSADEVLAMLSEHARGTLEPFLQQQGENIWIDLTTAQAKERIGLLKKVKTKRRRYGKPDEPIEEFETEIEIHDPQAALVTMGKHHKLFVDRQEHQGSMTIHVVYDTDDDKNNSK